MADGDRNSLKQMLFKFLCCKCWQGCGEKGTLSYCWWECKLVQPLWKTVWRFLKKLKTELSYDPVIPPVGIYLKKPKTLIQKTICTCRFIAMLFAIAKLWKQPIARWVGVKAVVHIYNTILFGHYKEWNFAI